MRRLLITIAMLSAMVAPASALQASDTMKAWKNASDKERSDLLAEILGKRDARSAGVAKCMTETSTTPGHGDLAIGDIAKVCASRGVAEQPV